MSSPLPSDVPEVTGSAKYVRLSRKLADRITAGEWADGRLPTVREIALEYRVSSFTASRALHLLQEKGMVVTKERSGCFVAPVPQTVAERWALVFRGTDDGVSARDAFERSAEDSGNLVAFPFVPKETSSADAVTAVAGTGVRGLIFLTTTTDEAGASEDEKFVTGCRAIGLPVVMIVDYAGRDRGLHVADEVAGENGSSPGVARWALRLLCHRLEDPLGPPVRVTVRNAHP